MYPSEEHDRRLRAVKARVDPGDVFHGFLTVSLLVSMGWMEFARLQTIQIYLILVRTAIKSSRIPHQRCLFRFSVF